MLADRLHKTLEEIRNMPNDEYESWLAYLQLERERAHHASVISSQLGAG